MSAAKVHDGLNLLAEVSHMVFIYMCLLFVQFSHSVVDFSRLDDLTGLDLSTANEHLAFAVRYHLDTQLLNFALARLTLLEEAMLTVLGPNELHEKANASSSAQGSHHWHELASLCIGHGGIRSTIFNQFWMLFCEVSQSIDHLALLV